jgi:hypothetical protein
VEEEEVVIGKVNYQNQTNQKEKVRKVMEEVKVAILLSEFPQHEK